MTGCWAADEATGAWCHQPAPVRQQTHQTPVGGTYCASVRGFRQQRVLEECINLTHTTTANRVNDRTHRTPGHRCSHCTWHTAKQRHSQTVFHLLTASSPTAPTAPTAYRTPSPQPRRTSSSCCFAASAIVPCTAQWERNWKKLPLNSIRGDWCLTTPSCVPHSLVLRRPASCAACYEEVRACKRRGTALCRVVGRVHGCLTGLPSAAGTPVLPHAAAGVTSLPRLSS